MPATIKTHTTSSTAQTLGDRRHPDHGGL